MTSTEDDVRAPNRRDWIGLAVLSLGLGMIVLDGTIVGVALPTIIVDLDLDLADAQWVNSLYAVIAAALFLPAIGESRSSSSCRCSSSTGWGCPRCRRVWCSR